MIIRDDLRNLYPFYGVFGMRIWSHYFSIFVCVFGESTAYFW